MKSNELHYISAGDASRAIARKQLSPVELLDATLRRIEAAEPKLNSFITLMADEAKQVAKEREAEARAGKLRGPLHGIPVGIKDIIDVKGVRTTAGSKIMADYVAPEDATVVRKLREAGAIILGKTNCHEFAWGGTNINPHWGDCHNPWNVECITGGSSGGSAAAVAAGLCTVALGSDTGGSVRGPARLCGIVGHKPTFGRVSRHGVVPLSWSLDHIGPMTRTVEDAAIVLGVIAGRDRRDPHTSARPVPDYTTALTGDIKGMRVGLPEEYFAEAMDPEVEKAVREAVSVLERLGAKLEEVSFISEGEMFALARVIHMSESSAFHDRWIRTRPQDYGPDVRARIEQGRMFLATDYVRAQQARTVICQKYTRLMKQVDVLAFPASPIVAPPIKGGQVTLGGRQVDAHAAAAMFLRAANLLGAPTMSVPCGFNKDGMPIGFQISGRLHDDASVFRAAYAYQQATAWKDRHPSV